MSSSVGEPAASPRGAGLAPRFARVTPDSNATGVSASGYALLALLALVTARGVAPALPGSATGIAPWITAAAYIAACLSQLLAAGGVVLCIRLLGLVSALPSLGVAFRMAMLPAGLGVVALVAAAAARPLDADLGRALVIAATVAAATTAPHLVGLRWARLPGLTLATLALAGALDLMADELGARAGGSTVKAALAIGAAYATTALSVVAATLALGWVARDRRDFVRLVSGSALGVALILGVSLLGRAHTANVALVLAHRSLEALSVRQFLPIPLLLAEAATSYLLIAAGVALVGARARRAELRAAVALCLLGSVVPGAPASALVTVAGALILSRAATDPHAAREQSPRTR